MNLFRCEEELFDLQKDKQELERTLLSKDKEIYHLQTDLKEARDLLKANQGVINQAQPLVEKIDQKIENEKLIDDEQETKNEMLSNIQLQLEQLTTTKKRSSEVNHYRDEIRKVTRQLKEAQKKESEMKKENQKLQEQIKKLELDLDH